MSSPTSQLEGQGRSDRTKHLVATLKAGGDREEIFRNLFDLWRRPIHAFFRRKSFSAEDCRDLAQETFLRAFKEIDGFRGESRFEGWLYGIATNVLKKEIRRRKAIKRAMTEVSLEDLTVEPPGEAPFLGGTTAANPEGKLLDKERRELVRAEVEKMPPRMQKCYKLWAKGREYDEIAEQMEITIDAVKGHLGAAKARLRRRLGEIFDEDDPRSD